MSILKVIMSTENNLLRKKPKLLRNSRNPNLPWFNDYLQNMRDHLHFLWDFHKRHPAGANKTIYNSFRSSYAENCLLLFGEESYIVSRKNNSETKTFSCTVSYIGTDHNTKNYVYQIVLENEKKSQAHVIINKWNAQTKFNVDFITKILDNPSSIIAIIDNIGARRCRQ